MLKYVHNQVTFSEVPDEISLCIDISNCPNCCTGCHSPELRQDIGEPLTIAVIEDLLTTNEGVTCVCFMGGDAEPIEVNNLSKWVHEHYGNTIKTAWYSGKDEYPKFIPDFDYVKIGSYREDDGPLNCRTTNQRMVKINRPKPGELQPEYSWYMEDITYKFWK
jgi:anaerobic ribonucleoside-triphosphate reductase activating protein